MSDLWKWMLVKVLKLSVKAKSLDEKYYETEVSFMYEEACRFEYVICRQLRVIFRLRTLIARDRIHELLRSMLRSLLRRLSVRTVSFRCTRLIALVRLLTMHSPYWNISHTNSMKWIADSTRAIRGESDPNGRQESRLCKYFQERFSNEFNDC